MTAQHIGCRVSMRLPRRAGGTRLAALAVPLACIALLAGCQQVPKAGNAVQAQSPPPPASSRQAVVAQPATAQPARAPAPSVQFRLAQAQPGRGLRVLNVQGQTYYFQRTPVLTRADLQSVTPIRTPLGQAYVRMEFTHAGARKLAQISSQWLNRWLILTLDDKQLVSVAKIAEPMTAGVLNLTMASEQRAVKVADAILGRRQR